MKEQPNGSSKKIASVIIVAVLAAVIIMQTVAFHLSISLAR